MKFIKNKTAFALILGSASGLLLIILAAGNVFDIWQLHLSDFLFSPRKTSEEIVIVPVDDKTISRLGPFDTWDRGNFAKVLENINKYDPKVVAFDFFFKSAKDPQTDEAFKEALQKTKAPVIFYQAEALQYDSHGYYIQPEQIRPLVLPLELLSNLPNMSMSMATALADPDKVLRKTLPIIRYENGQYYENLAITIARIALGGEAKPAQPLISPSQYQVKIANGTTLNIPLEKGQMIINYASSPNTDNFTKIPFVDVYLENYQPYGKTPEEFFKDKIVLIGPTARDFKDSQLTPMSSKDPMSGVSIHANALQTILEQKFLRNLTFAEKSILIIILALTAAFTFMFTKIRWSLLYLFGVPTAYSLAAKPAFNAGIILDLTHPYVTIAVTFVAVYLYRYVTEFKEKKELQSAFGKYVNPTLVKQITEHPESLKLGGEIREVTVMFTDIVHSSALGEKLKPESLVALLNEYFEAMSDVIMAEGGTVDKFEGDGIMAFFGAPVAQPDHSIRAARAAVNMRIKLNELLEKWGTGEFSRAGIPASLLPGGELKPPLDFRCGLSSGEVIVGNIGSASRFNYTVMGDVVNLGSRLEGANKEYGTSTMCGEETYQKIQSEYVCRELDILQVVGKKQAVKVYEIINEKSKMLDYQLHLVDEYAQGIALYRQRKFAEALSKFKTIVDSGIDDGPSKLYIQRCEIYKDYPPPANWTGVFEMRTK